MNRFLCLLLSGLLGLGSLPLVTVYPQSGRGRRPTPQPEKPPERTPAPAPPQRVPVPDGGRIAQQQGDGVTSQFRLRNGLTVIIHEAHALPLAAVVTHVRAGHLHEEDNLGGAASLLRHLLFEGAPAAAQIRSLGGVAGADTSYDYTSYYAVVPAPKLGDALAAQAGALLRPTFEPSALGQEALAVIQEGRQRYDDPRAHSLERLYTTAFQQHRLKRPSNRSEDALKAVTREQLQAFYQGLYQPGNMVVVVTGAVRASAVLPRIQQLYGALAPAPAATAAAAAAPEEPAPTALRYANERGDISQTLVNIGYRVPDLRSAEAPAVQVLAALLGRGRGARLYRTLRDGSGLASDVSVDYLGLPGAGYLSVRLWLEPRKIDDAEAAYFGEIEKLRRELPSEGDLQRAQAQLEKDFADASATLEGQARVIAYYQAAVGDYKKAFSQVARIRAVTAEQVQQAAAKYLTLPNTTVFEYEPKAAAPRTFPSAEAFAETVRFWAPRSQQLTVAEGEVRAGEGLAAVRQGPERQNQQGGIVIELLPQPVKSFATLHGPRVYVREDHSQPSVTVGLYFEGGRLLEAPAEHGLTELMLRAMLRSVKGGSADQVAVEIEQLGGRVEVVNEPDFYGFTLDVLSRNAPAAMGLLIDIIERPTFDKAALAREKGGLLARLRRELDDPQARPLELFRRSLFPNHPYGRSRYGDEAVINAATEDTLKAWHAKTVQRQYPLAVIVGDTDGSALVGRHLTEGFLRRELDQTYHVPLPSAAAPFQEAAEKRERRQTAQVVGFPGPKGESGDNYALAVIRALAGGSADDFFNQPASLAGAFAAYTAGAPTDEAAARARLLGELQQLATREVSDQELALGQNGAAGDYNVALQRHPFHALEYARAAFFKRPVEQVDAYDEQVKAVGKAEVKRVAAEYFKANQAAVGVVRGTGNK